LITIIYKHITIVRLKFLKGVLFKVTLYGYV
jgi:hypothetical protein